MTEKEKCAKILALALQQLGVKESPAGSNNVKFNTWFYGKEVRDDKVKNLFYPWCATCVSWLYHFSGFPLGNVGYTRGFASVPYALANVHKWGKVVPAAEAQPGYIVIFDWNLDKKADHVGILYKKNENGTFEALEGNTAVGNDSNGGEFMQRNRSYKNATFIRPNCLDNEVDLTIKLAA